MVNAALVILDKAGRRVAGPVRLADFFMTDPATPCASDAGDVLVLDDQLAGRWLVTQFTLPLDQNGAITGPNQLCVADLERRRPGAQHVAPGACGRRAGGFVDYPKRA